jgi:hypothetical protein
MSISLLAKTNKKATLKLVNHISSFLFEQECGELAGQKELTASLKAVNKKLAESLRRN